LMSQPRRTPGGKGVQLQHFPITTQSGLIGVQRRLSVRQTPHNGQQQIVILHSRCMSSSSSSSSSWLASFLNRIRPTKSVAATSRSSGSAGSGSGSSNSNSHSSWRNGRFFTWRRAAVVVRALRIPFIVVSVYSLGYQQGVMECTKHPERLADEILYSILLGVGVKSMDDQVLILSETEIRQLSASRPHQVAAVGHRIISAARDYVQDELQKAMQLVELPIDMAPELAMGEYMKDEQVQFWYNAALRLLGEGHQPIPGSSASSSSGSGGVGFATTPRKPWQYIFIESAVPNAFVTEILPQRFFITTAMLQVAETPDELAMVLGHEVSHLILGHVSQSNQVETFWRTIEVLLLSLDPTEGLIALAVIGALATMRQALMAAHSRENEYEADELGIVLTARACFDTVAGVEVMRKMAEQAIAPATSPAGAKKAATADSVSPLPTSSRSPPPPSQVVLTRFLDTHPPTMERYRILQEKSETENYTKYDHEQCASISRRLYAAIWGSSADGDGK
jgi:Peptidase family M48